MLSGNKIMKDPDHPIIKHPFTYRVVSFHYERDLANGGEPFIDIVLQKDQIIRRLRFFKPQNLRIEEGFPHVTGLFITDTTNRGLENLNVQVGDFEMDGGIWFWAREVVDLDQVVR